MKAEFSKITEIFTRKGKISYYFLLGMVGIMLIISGDSTTKDEKEYSEENQSLQEYKLIMEKEMTSFLKEIDGVGEVKVMISFESGQEKIYVQQEKSASSSQDNSRGNEGQHSFQSTYENQYVIIDNAGKDTALIEKTLQPQIKGVAVVCSGADDISVVAAVTNSVSVVLDVPTHKIFVTKMR